MLEFPGYFFDFIRIFNIQQTVHMIHWQVGTSPCSGANYRHHFRRGKIPYNHQLKTSNVDFLRAELTYAITLTSKF